MNNQDRSIFGLLLIGFGGLIALLAFSSLNTLSVLSRIQTRSDQIRADYVNRNQILDHLRSDIYQSGTFVRDFVLESDPRAASIHRIEFNNSRRRIEAGLTRYKQIQREDEKAALRSFDRELTIYLDLLNPALHWNTAERRTLGYSFMRDFLLPRRQIIVNLADQISRVNDNQLEEGNRQVTQLFAEFRRSSLRLFILAVSIGTLLAAVSIIRILRLERLSQVRFGEVLQTRSDLRDLSTRLLDLQEAERRALSRELHDEVGQSLSALLLGIGNVAATLAPIDHPAAEQLTGLQKMTEKTIATVRDMSLLLRPSMLDDLGLVPALQWQAREMSRTRQLPVKIFAGALAGDLPDDYKTCVYRIVQEALANVARHARAKCVEIHLNEDNGGLSLRIQDDGQGFTPAVEKGVGLLGMEERILHLGGQFHLQSQLGQGTLITVHLPLSGGLSEH